MKAGFLRPRRPLLVSLLASAVLATTGYGLGNAQATEHRWDASAHASKDTAPVRLPVVACPTGETPDLTGLPLKRNAHWIWVSPQNLPRYVQAPISMPAHVAAHLARYEGDVKHARDMNVLAPRGWKCWAYIPEDGNWDLVVASREARPRQQIRVSFRWASQGALLACGYFGAARIDAPQPDLCRTPPHTAVTLRTRHLATFVTTPAGTWTPFPARGFLYWYPKGRAVLLLAEETRCVLPVSARRLCERVLADAQRRQGNELAR